MESIIVPTERHDESNESFSELNHFDLGNM